MTMDTQNTAPLSNALIDRSRIRGASRMIPQGTDPTRVTPEQIDAVRNDVLLFCKNNDISQKALAKATGYSQGVVSDFLKSSYRGNNAQVAIDLEDWLTTEEERRKNTQSAQFVWTNVAQQIKSLADYCLDKTCVGLVYGPETSGLGKTCAFQAIHQLLGLRRSTLVTFDKCDANPTGLLKKILAGLRLDDRGSSSQRFQRIVEHLKGMSHLMLVDQVHNLRFSKEDKPFYILMDIYDRTQTAQLWAGTSDLVAYLNRQREKTLDEPLAQIRRRIFPQINLYDYITKGNNGGGGQPLYTTDQIRQVFSKFQLKLTPAATRWMTALANEPGSGGLGICVKLMEYASFFAQMKGMSAIDVLQLQDALKYSPNGRLDSLAANVDRAQQVETIAKIA